MLMPQIKRKTHIGKIWSSSVLSAWKNYLVITTNIDVICTNAFTIITVFFVSNGPRSIFYLQSWMCWVLFRILKTKRKKIVIFLETHQAKAKHLFMYLTPFIIRTTSTIVKFKLLPSNNIPPRNKERSWIVIYRCGLAVRCGFRSIVHHINDLVRYLRSINAKSP